MTPRQAGSLPIDLRMDPCFLDIIILSNTSESLNPFRVLKSSNADGIYRQYLLLLVLDWDVALWPLVYIYMIMIVTS